MTRLAAVTLLPPGASCTIDPMCGPAQGIASAAGHAVAGVARSASTDAAMAVFHALLASVAHSATAVTTKMLGALLQTAEPDALQSGWLLTELGLMAKVTALVVVPLLMAATIGALIRQDPGRLVRTWLVWLPLAATLTVVMIPLVEEALSATDEMTHLVTGDLSHNVQGAISNLAPSALTLGDGVLSVVFAGLILLASLVIWLEMVLRSSAILITIFFLPLLLAGLVWPATAHMVRRTIEVLVALILSQFVIGAVLGLGVAALGNRPVPRGATHPVAQPDVIAGVAILLLAAFAPMALLRLIPLVEAAAISHLEGRARQPVRALRDAAQRFPHQAPLAARLLGEGGGAPGGGGPGGVGEGPHHGDGQAAAVPGVPVMAGADPGAGAAQPAEDRSASAQPSGPGHAPGGPTAGDPADGGSVGGVDGPTDVRRGAAASPGPVASWAAVAPAAEDLG